MSRNRRVVLLLVTILISMLLQGCLYPKELRNENQQSARDGILLVQNAVDEYQKQTQLLPIITSDMDVPRYEKFRIDLELLKRRGVLGSSPDNAFEAGGTGTYLIIDEETDPKVRIMDLLTAQRVNDLTRAVDSYKRKQGSLPAAEEVYPGFYGIDEGAAGVRPSEVLSPFTGQPLSFMMDKEGRVYADYAPDIMQLVEKSEQRPTGKEKDLRPLLVESSFYVPVKSVAYIWKDNAPWPQAESTPQSK
ncbi:hypothetical protein [Paenibacillus apiarius]|uniref:Uncharacterized protein n=1 Tax=Paenibacillus apiarius TaxID=46240 RepID=A0ABT4DSF2_9BACL|nr:hypothetical protein [Paenibacillus apiarius]MCY9517128.1 hypothetical protein [Paenibacillus apiarius]MCY9520175.1 hypothetical protein [Paenibacillus apiarius]MCY9554937.1 hypothetical protein [Paenibacillus apiarius]MCY9561448.1 hypothetical protein [Paenibacillus apiarius]MCY9685970.1 hypothetical protein [Paenibacillus apiarius]